MAVLEEAKDPVRMALSDGTEESSYQSIKEYLAVAMTCLLFSVSTYVKFLSIRTDLENKDLHNELYLNYLKRWFAANILMTQGAFDRLSKRPTMLAEDKVQEEAIRCQNKLSKYKRTDWRLKGEREYHLQILEVVSKQTLLAMRAALNKQ